MSVSCVVSTVAICLKKVFFFLTIWSFTMNESSLGVSSTFYGTASSWAWQVRAFTRWKSSRLHLSDAVDVRAICCSIWPFWASWIKSFLPLTLDLNILKNSALRRISSAIIVMISVLTSSWSTSMPAIASSWMSRARSLALLSSVFYRDSCLIRFLLMSSNSFVLLLPPKRIFR